MVDLSADISNALGSDTSPPTGGQPTAAPSANGPPIVVHTQRTAPAIVAPPNNAQAINTGAPEGPPAPGDFFNDTISAALANKPMPPIPDALAKQGYPAVTPTPSASPPSATSSSPALPQTSQSAQPLPLSAVPADAAKGFGTGLVQGTAGTIGALGGEQDMQTKQEAWGIAHSMAAMGMLPSGMTPESLSMGIYNAARQSRILPTPTDVYNTLKSITGEYLPQTRIGQYANTAGQFIPGAVAMGGAGAANILKNAILPAFTSETAGQLAHAWLPQAEGFARGVGAVAGGVGGYAINEAGDMIGNLFTSKPDIGAAQAAQRQGVALPKVAVAGQPAASGMAMSMKSLPMMGTPVRTAADTAMGQIQAAGQRAAEIPTGGVATTQQAGQGLQKGLENYIGPQTRDNQKTLYDAVDNQVDPDATYPLDNTLAKIQEINDRHNAAFLPESPAVKMVSNAAGSQDGVTYQGTKFLRTNIRQMIDQGRLPADVNPAEAEELHGALTKDLKANIDQNGPAARATWDKANKYSALLANQREKLNNFLGDDARQSPEGLVSKIVNIAGNKGTANVGLLQNIKLAVHPDVWADLQSNIVSKMGMNDKGEFSGDMFETQYGKMPTDSKTVLFGEEGTPLRDALDDQRSLARAMRQGLAKYGNTSGTTQTAAGLGELWAAAKMIGKNVVLGPLGAAGTLIGGRALAAFLSRPVTADMVTKWMRVYGAANANPNPAWMGHLANAAKPLISAAQGYYTHGTLPPPATP